MSAKEKMSLSPRSSTGSRHQVPVLQESGGKVSICIPEVSQRIARLPIKIPIAPAAAAPEMEEGENKR